MIPLCKKLLDYRDKNLVNQFSDKEKITIANREVGIENPRKHGKADKVYAVCDDKTVVYLHDDHGFKEDVSGRDECITAIQRFGELSKDGFFNQAEKKLLFLAKDGDSELTKLFWYKHWHAGFKFKLVKERGMSYFAVFLLEEVEITKEKNRLVNLFTRQGVKCTEIKNFCFTVLPAITHQDPLVNKNYCYSSVFNHHLPDNFLYWQMEDKRELFKVLPFAQYIEQLAIFTEEFEIKHKLKLVGSPIIEKECFIRLKVYFCPDFYQGKTRKLLNKTKLTRRHEDIITPPSTIFSFPVMKKITGGYTRFDEPMQATESFDYRALGIKKLRKLTTKAEIQHFVEKIHEHKLAKLDLSNMENIGSAEPNLVLMFSIEDVEDLHEIGPDSFDVIPGLFWTSKQFARHLRQQFEEESFRNKLYKNDKFKALVAKLDDILPVNKEKYQQMIVSVDDQVTKIRRDYKFTKLNGVEIKPTDELSVSGTHSVYVIDTLTDKKVKFTENAIRFKDPSIVFEVITLKNDTVLRFYVPEHNLSLPFDKDNIELRQVCTLDEYKKNKEKSYEQGGPSPCHRTISIQLRHDEGWSNIAKWRELPEQGHHGGGTGVVREKYNDIADESIKSDKPIFRLYVNNKKLRVNINNKHGSALMTSEKGINLQTKAEKIYNSAVKFAKSFSSDIKDATRSINQQFQSDEELAEAYENDFEWYLFDKAIQRHIEEELLEFYKLYQEESDED